MEREAAALREVVERTLAEDLGAGDITCACSVPAERRAQARIVSRERAVVAGIGVAEACFSALDPGARVEAGCAEGDVIAAGTVVLAVEGRAGALLGAERSALNFLQRLCGIATATRAFVDALAGTGVRVLDTRKTTPGLRALEKHAVRTGGGQNHRFGLFDQILLKENHFALAAPRGYEDVVRAAVASSSAPVVAEARDQAEAVAAVRGGAAVVLLDNFRPGPDLTSAVHAVRETAVRLGRQVEIEASGGITLANVRAFAACGIDRVSVGALTHSVKAIDLSLLVEGLR